MFRDPDQVIQPFEFGHDASKKTCLWLKGLPTLEPTKYIEPRMICADCKGVSTYAAAFGKGCVHCGAEAGRLRPRWANQTDSGQNKIGPSDDRDKIRSETFQGIADAMALRWGISTIRDNVNRGRWPRAGGRVVIYGASVRKNPASLTVRRQRREAGRSGRHTGGRVRPGHPGREKHRSNHAKNETTV